MLTTKAKQGQSFLDLVLQQSGSFTDVVSSALLNGRSLTDDININQSVLVNEISDPEQVKIFTGNKPATALSKQTDTAEGKGIGWMIIEKTFIVG